MPSVPPADLPDSIYCIVYGYDNSGEQARQALPALLSRQALAERSKDDAGGNAPQRIGRIAHHRRDAGVWEPPDHDSSDDDNGLEEGRRKDCTRDVKAERTVTKETGEANPSL